MGVGDEWTGEYSYTTIVEGEWTVLPWSSCRVLINSINVTGLLQANCMRNNNFSSGNCTLIASDPEQTQYLLFQPGDVIEIYMSLSETANKVWCGHIENLKYSNDQGGQLTITGKEYSQRLINQVFTDTFASEELSDALATIFGNQTNYSTNIATTVGKAVSGAFTNESIFNAAKKFCDQYGYIFYVDLDGVIQTKLRTDLAYSADAITAGDNVTKTRAEQTDKQYLCNSVTVRGSSSTSESASDATSQTTYGVHSKQITVGSLNSAATVQQYATEYIATYKDPLTNQRLLTKPLLYTDPNEYIQIEVSSLGLTGYYQAVEIAHKWGIGVGFATEIEISTKLRDTALQLGDFERRIRDTENEAF